MTLAAEAYRPRDAVVWEGGLHLRRIAEESDAVRERFVSEVVAAISGSYDEIGRPFAENLVAVDVGGFDPHGFFTLGKEVWVARLGGPDGDLVGFEVITRKRGGSIKLGPTVVLEPHRGHGMAQRIIEPLLAAYHRAGARKVYVTAPLDHAAAAALDLRHLAFSPEAILRDQYRSGASERVFGRMLSPYDTAEPVDASVDLGDGSASASVSVVNGLDGWDEQAFRNFLVARMRPTYDDIDEAFAASVVEACRRGPEGAYEQKGKTLVALWASGAPLGCAICSPKRGGAVKVSPVLIEPAYRTPEVLGRLHRALQERVKTLGKRKLFFLVPVADWNLVRLFFARGLSFEGILRSPYKAGRDMVVLSDFLR